MADAPHKTRKVLRIEREARFEAARGVLLSRLDNARREDGWLRAAAVVGRHQRRDVELRFPGAAGANQVQVRVRIRTGGPFRAATRARILRWMGGGYLSVRGRTPVGVAEALEVLFRDHGVWVVTAGDGLLQASLSWNALDPDPEGLLKVVDRLHRIGLVLEGERAPRVETGGDLLCPFCHEFIREHEPLARCESCATPYHPSCFEEGGGCSIYGCDTRTARTSSGTYPTVPPAPDPKQDASASP